jgi:hypothetical protein
MARWLSWRAISPLTCFSQTWDSKEETDGGIELAMLAAEIRPGLKVLYKTGRPVTDGTRARFLEGSKLLAKPYTVDQLLHALSVYFDIKPATPS